MRGFLDDVLVGGRADELDNFVSTETSIQHDPLIGDGVDGLRAFRVADGVIVEHWDVMEEITPEETWVSSGKF